MSTLRTNAVETLDGRGQVGLTFNSVDQLKSSGTLKPGQTVSTKGYYADGDGGSNDYVIELRDGSADDGGSVIYLDDGVHQARGLFGSGSNIKQFGAVGDGVVDDTSAIQNAINYGPVEIPWGTYGYTKLTITEGAFVSGVGTKKSVLRSLSTSAANTIEIAGSSQWTLKDFSVNGENPSGTDTGHNGIVITSNETESSLFDSREWFIANVRVERFGGTGFLVEKAISPGGAWGRTGNISAMQLRSNYRGAWFLDRGEYITVTGMHAWKNARGLELQAGNVKFIGCQFDDNANGAILNSGINDHHGAFSSCSFNHNNDFDLWIQSSTKGQNFDDCSFFDGVLRVDNSKGISFNGGNLAVSIIDLRNNTGSIIFNDMLVREDSTNTLVLTGDNEYQFINCRDRNGLYSKNTGDKTYNAVSRTSNLSNSLAERVIAWTAYDAKITGGNDTGGKVASNEYPIFETGFYIVSFSCDYSISGETTRGVQKASILRKRGGVTAPVATALMVDKTSGSSGVVTSILYLEAGDNLSAQLTDSAASDGDRAVVASGETYFTLTLSDRIVQ